MPASAQERHTAPKTLQILSAVQKCRQIASVVLIYVAILVDVDQKWLRTQRLPVAPGISLGVIHFRGEDSPGFQREVEVSEHDSILGTSPSDLLCKSVWMRLVNTRAARGTG